MEEVKSKMREVLSNVKFEITDPTNLQLLEDIENQSEESEKDEPVKQK